MQPFVKESHFHYIKCATINHVRDLLLTAGGTDGRLGLSSWDRERNILLQTKWKVIYHRPLHISPVDALFAL